MKINREIYLDSAASASNPKFHVIDNFANPNSTHDAGRIAFSVLENSREEIAKCIGAKRPSELIFTSGATEANNIAVLGIAKAQQKVQKFKNKAKILITSIEHESVLAPAKHLESLGFKLDFLPVDNSGFVDYKSAEKKIDMDTVLVSVQLANTEIGVIQNLAPLVELAHKSGAVFHSDCVGALGRIPIDVSKLGLDAVSFAGHKIGSPKGIGALYLKTKTKCEPLIFGSSQEKGLRGGTQNVALAKSFAMACNHSIKNMDKTAAHHVQLKDHLYSKLKDVDGLRFTVEKNPDYQNYLPNIVHIVFKNQSSENLVLQYGKFGIIVSGGPACSSQDKEPSHVLKSVKVDKAYIDGAIRVSFLDDTSIADIDKFIEATKEICKQGG